MIKQRINFFQFCDSFSDTYKNNFTYEGKKALFEYLEELSDDIGENIELDPISLCCEYDEYANFDDIKQTYPNIKDIDDLRDYTQVIEFNEGIIIQAF